MTPPDGKLPKREHLLKTGDFRSVYRLGRSGRRGALAIYAAPNTLEHSRVGFSIRSSTVKLASRRNRIRRVLREIYRINKDGFKKGLDIVVVVKRDPGPIGMHDNLKDAVLKLALDLGILTKGQA